jgi:hypothetical protein
MADSSKAPAVAAPKIEEAAEPAVSPAEAEASGQHVEVDDTHDDADSAFGEST